MKLFERIISYWLDSSFSKIPLYTRNRSHLFWMICKKFRAKSGFEYVLKRTSFLNLSLSLKFLYWKRKKKLCQREPHHYVAIKNSSINCNLLWFLFDFIISTNRSGTIVWLFCVRVHNETNPICICDELMSVFWKLRCFEVIEWNEFVHPIEFEGQHHIIVT